MNNSSRQERAIRSEISAIRKYAEQYECSIPEAAYDVLTDEPCTRSLAQLVCERLGIWDASLGFWNARLTNYRWNSIEEVRKYQIETYDN